MPLTDTQLQTFSTDIAANVAEWPTGLSNHNVIRDWYNEEAAPAVVVWKTAVSTDDAATAIDYTEYMDVPVLGGNDIAGLKLAMEQLTLFNRQTAVFDFIMRNGSFDPSLQTIRDALTAIFAGDTNTRDGLLAIAKRNANRVEALFAGAPVQGARVMAFEGSVSTTDVTAAVNLIP